MTIAASEQAVRQGNKTRCSCDKTCPASLLLTHQSVDNFFSFLEADTIIIYSRVWEI